VRAPPHGPQNINLIASSLCQKPVEAMWQCENANGQGNSKCKMAELGAIVCMASVNQRERVEEFLNCFNTTPDQCQPMLSGLVDGLTEMSNTEAAPLSVEEKRTVEECYTISTSDFYGCVIPRFCPSSFETFDSCLKSNKGNIDKCLPEGLSVMECWGQTASRLE